MPYFLVVIQLSMALFHMSVCCGFSGMLKMKRRYRILLQMDKLKKAMKDKKANHTKNVKNMMSSVWSLNCLLL